jgi:sulfate adenylyltransferase subunit 1 (EFTu-like GTPase family)
MKMKPLSRQIVFMRTFLDRSRAAARWTFVQPAVATQDVKCEVVSIERVMDSSTLESKGDGREQLERNEIGRLTIQPRTTRHR